MSLQRVFSVTVLIVGLAVFFWMRGCDQRRPDIEVRDGVVHVRNNTDQAWRNVRIWVNDHYAAVVPEVPPAGFVREPLTRFVASQGQTINTATTPITSVVVLGTGPNGERIRVVWGAPQWH